MIVPGAAWQSKSEETAMASKSDKLAIDGGRPVNERPFPFWPEFDRKVCEGVVQVLLWARRT